MGLQEVIGHLPDGAGGAVAVSAGPAAGVAAGAARVAVLRAAYETAHDQRDGAAQNEEHDPARCIHLSSPPAHIPGGAPGRPGGHLLSSVSPASPVSPVAFARRDVAGAGGVCSMLQSASAGADTPGHMPSIKPSRAASCRHVAQPRRRSFTPYVRSPRVLRVSRYRHVQHVQRRRAFRPPRVLFYPACRPVCRSPGRAARAGIRWQSRWRWPPPCRCRSRRR